MLVISLVSPSFKCFSCSFKQFRRWQNHFILQTLTRYSLSVCSNISLRLPYLIIMCSYRKSTFLMHHFIQVSKPSDESVNFEISSTGWEEVCGFEQCWIAWVCGWKGFNTNVEAPISIAQAGEMFTGQWLLNPLHLEKQYGMSSGATLRTNFTSFNPLVVRISAQPSRLLFLIYLFLLIFEPQYNSYLQSLWLFVSQLIQVIWSHVRSP